MQNNQLYVSDFENYIDLSEEILFIKLGETIDELNSLNIQPLSTEEKEKIGRAYLKSKIHYITEILCKKEIRNLRKDNSKVELALVIADVLSAVLTGIPLIIITCLIVEIGIDEFCKKNDKIH